MALKEHDTMAYLPVKRAKPHRQPPRVFVLTVVNSLHPGFIQKLANSQVEKRFKFEKVDDKHEPFEVHDSVLALLTEDAHQASKFPF
jgi:hypothetical protein